MGSTLDAVDDLFTDLECINIDHATNKRFAFYSQ